MNTVAAECSFVFLANHTALDFVNTEIVAGGLPVNLIQSYDEFKSWLLASGILTSHQLEAAERSWSDADKNLLLDQALMLRAQLREAAGQIVTLAPVSTETVAAINDLLRHPVAFSQVEITPTGCICRQYYSLQRPADLLTPIAEAASDLLCNAEPAFIRKCENPACILYYYDTSKNHARRWCSMGVCGNRMKAAAHYRKARVGKP